MAASVSAKALSNLVCESSVRTSESVLSQELENNLKGLVEGVLLNAADPKAAKPAAPESSVKKQGKLSLFLKDLVGFLGVADDKGKAILTSYLASKSISLL